MKFKIETWTVDKLISKLDEINIQPEYQRGAVWSRRKASLLIDSMLRGIDIPKIYLRELDNTPHSYEVADGQQRINAIEKFYKNEIRLLSSEEKGLDLSKIGSKSIGGLKYNDNDEQSLPLDLRSAFKNYKLTISILKSANPNEVRTLFGRLQEGSPLNPAEKRNALISRIGREIDTFALNHNFFSNSRIPSNRYKYQDYLAHGLALWHYKNKRDLKADLLMEYYLDQGLAIDAKFQDNTAKVLDAMSKVDGYSQHRISRKFNFVDIFFYFSQNIGDIKKLNFKNFAQMYDSIEVKRLKFHGTPRTLLEGKPNKDDIILYDYVVSFRFNGASTESIKKRNIFYNHHYGSLFNLENSK